MACMLFAGGVVLPVQGSHIHTPLLGPALLCHMVHCAQQAQSQAMMTQLNKGLETLQRTNNGIKQAYRPWLLRQPSLRGCAV